MGRPTYMASDKFWSRRDSNPVLTRTEAPAYLLSHRCGLTLGARGREFDSLLTRFTLAQTTNKKAPYSRYTRQRNTLSVVKTSKCLSFRPLASNMKKNWGGTNQNGGARLPPKPSLRTDTGCKRSRDRFSPDPVLH